MAYENIQITQSNFCLGPQAGTICTIDTTNPQTVMRVKNSSGAIITELSLSSNIITNNIRLEYVGPYNLSSMVDELTFFTFEKVNSSSCIIKRWQTRMSYRELLLKEEVVKSSSGPNRFNAIDFAVEYYHVQLSRDNEYYNYIDVNDTTNMRSGDRLFIGPSTDTTNYGATETATISYIADYIGGKRVYLTTALKYQYAIGDSVVFYNNVYVYSSEGYDGDTANGSLFKLNAYNWSIIQCDTKAIYKKITAARWCPYVGGIASIIGTNMLFVRPYDYYLNWRSMFLNNVEQDNNTIFSVYDVIFDGYKIYKLQRKITLRSDSGTKNTYSWSTFNYQEDTLLPYTNSIVTWTEQSILTGYNKNVDIQVRVRDQYDVGLRDVTVNFYKSGDLGSLFDPLSGLVTTDSNGAAVINYRSGSTYSGHTNITTRAAGSSSSTGSAYVWTSNNIISLPSFTPTIVKLIQLKEISNYIGSIRQLWQEFRSTYVEGGVYKWNYPSIYIKGKSFFTAPGGDWGSGTGFVGPGEVKTWLPMLYRGLQQTDSPLGGTGFGFSNNWIGNPTSAGFIGNQIRLLEEFSSQNSFKCLTSFLIYPSGSSGVVPYVNIKQPSETSSFMISQLKLGLHSYWVDGVVYDYLWTYVKLNQFVFVEDAIPKFWSEKNPVSTGIWLRLRPFAFSLNNSTLRMWVKEVSYLGDTDYYEVTNSLSIDNFDAGGSLLGIELTYTPPANFLHGSIVFVRIEVYDTAYTPNFIYTDYWFKVVPDYKAPYLTNLSPDREDINIPVDTTIYFEIMDIGTGIDVDSLECLINSVRMDPNYLNVEVVSLYHLKVTYSPPKELYFDKDYKVTVKVNDTSPAVNKMNSSYTFYTAQSSEVQIVDPDPGLCKAGMGRFQNVSVKVLAGGNGVDEDSIKVQVFNKDIHPRITPIVYRIS